MKHVKYITGNEKKLQNAKAFLENYGIIPEMQKLDLVEIQADSAIEVALRKARDAYDIVKAPLFINDASWHILALNGFPGPYMKNVISWFTSEDLLALLDNKEDRTIILRDTIVYKDGNAEKVFTNDVIGQILTSPTEGNGPFITQLVSFEVSGRSLAEMNTLGFSDREKVLWQEFAEWVNSSQPA